MKNEPSQTHSLAAELSSEVGAANTSPPAPGPRPLRRWSVAELIARALAAPPADGIGPRVGGPISTVRAPPGSTAAICGYDC